MLYGDTSHNSKSNPCKVLRMYLKFYIRPTFQCTRTFLWRSHATPGFLGSGRQGSPKADLGARRRQKQEQKQTSTPLKDRTARTSQRKPRVIPVETLRNAYYQAIPNFHWPHSCCLQVQCAAGLLTSCSVE